MFCKLLVSNNNTKYKNLDLSKFIRLLNHEILRIHAKQMITKFYHKKHITDLQKHRKLQITKAWKFKKYKIIKEVKKH